MLVVKIASVVIVARMNRAFFYTGAAFYTNACVSPYIVAVDGAHRTDLRAKLTVGALITCERFYLADIYRSTLAVPWLIITR